MQNKNKRSGWIFFGIMMLIYLCLFFIDRVFFIKVFMNLIHMLTRIIPIFVLIFIIMIIINYYVTPKMIAKYLSKNSGIKKWIIAIVSGIISTGPVYMWYSVLKELKEKGVSYGFIAVFLYNRAIKPPLIPLMIYYFGLKFTIVLTLLTIFFSILEGTIIEKIMR